MDPARRKAMKALIASALLPLAGALSARTAQASVPLRTEPPVNVIIPTEYAPPVQGESAALYARRLSRAMLDFADAHFRGRKLPIWKRPYAEVDLEKRVVNACHWIVQGVRENEHIYPVDPAWVVAQITAESFFCEFAVSRAFAVGPCQLMPETAHDYKMLCAGDLPEHRRAPYRRTEWAREIDSYRALREKWKSTRAEMRKVGGDRDTLLITALQAAKSGKRLPMAEKYLQLHARVQEFDAQVKDARQKFRAYIEENLAGRDIFDEKDAQFLMGFDQRVMYRTSIPAMVRMIAKNLKARNGNIMAATAGYNAGLGNTSTGELIYDRYGRVPTFGETITYVNRVFINHHEIVKRMV
ncbi:soluble lytic murein transglycosylase-like protein [Desulfobaculum xiamenense]|uniref:Soluble lytic murein transglycosylase-like protein n=1 Tax=Desulfobaculum xiamenense TaxID=995050 RepID=A0A846QIX5_9BACT|nr:transglycosylase SLT domain-containing protein [Desulfobaculum xiamenense]NJB68826.1 soluble lytic murein transglycosylase-like protein [Desulfobaculum xiamenense]